MWSVNAQNQAEFEKLSKNSIHRLLLDAIVFPLGSDDVVPDLLQAADDKCDSIPAETIG